MAFVYIGVRLPFACVGIRLHWYLSISTHDYDKRLRPGSAQPALIAYQSSHATMTVTALGWETKVVEKSARKHNRRDYFVCRNEFYIYAICRTQASLSD